MSRPLVASPIVALWRRLPTRARLALLISGAMILFPPSWRLYAWWWDLWNGPGTFYARWLPVVR